MKYYHIIVVLLLSFFVNSCTNLNKIFSDEKPVIEKSFVKKINNCPKSRIPYTTSFAKNSKLEAKIIKVSSSCKFISNNDSSDKKKTLQVNFKIYISISSQNKIEQNALRELRSFIAILNEKNQILTKLIAPIEKRDKVKKIKSEKKIIVIQREFKVIYNENNNHNLRIFYGFER